MSEETIYDRIAKLESSVAAIQKNLDILMDLSKNKLIKLEVKRVKNG